MISLCTGLYASLELSWCLLPSPKSIDFSNFDPFGSGKILDYGFELKIYLRRGILLSAVKKWGPDYTLHQLVQISEVVVLQACISESLHGTVSSMSYSNEFFLKSSGHFSNWYEQKSSVKCNIKNK